MPLNFPDGARTAVAITCDFDAHSAWIGAYKTTSPAALSRGEFGAEVGVPRLLALFRELAVVGKASQMASASPADRELVQVR